MISNIFENIPGEENRRPEPNWIGSKNGGGKSADTAEPSGTGCLQLGLVEASGFPPIPSWPLS